MMATFHAAEGDLPAPLWGNLQMRTAVITNALAVFDVSAATMSREAFTAAHAMRPPVHPGDRAVIRAGLETMIPGLASVPAHVSDDLAGAAIALADAHALGASAVVVGLEYHPAPPRTITIEAPACASSAVRRAAHARLTAELANERCTWPSWAHRPPPQLNTAARRWVHASLAYQSAYRVALYETGDVVGASDRQTSVARSIAQVDKWVSLDARPLSFSLVSGTESAT